jgi:phosphoribosylamine-glycine ligase
VRHGDPEFEVLSRKLSTDFFELGMAVWEGTLDQTKQVWNDRHYVDVIAMEGRSKASRGWNPGYPKRYGKGHRITGLDELDRGLAVYFAGVDHDPERGLVTYGGRVLHLVAGGDTLEEARRSAYANIEKLSFVDHRKDGANCMRYRRSIGV